MPFIFKLLKAGTLTSGVNVAYTVPANTQTVVSTMRFFSEPATSVDIAVKSTSSSAPQKVKSGFAVGDGQQVFTTPLTLSAGNQIEITAAASGVECVISGVERV